METSNEILSTMELIQNLSTSNLQDLLSILKTKLVDEQDMEFATYVLPLLVMKIKVFNIFNKDPNEIIDKICEIIGDTLPRFKNYFNNKQINEGQSKGFLSFCKIMTFGPC